MIVVVMGVSGCGKSSVGRALAACTGWTFIEGDDLHPAANRAKMAAGTPLDDDDRWPWLDVIAETARTAEANGSSVIVACSALKRAYRDRIRNAGRTVKFIHLDGDRDTIHERIRLRRDHFMPPGLLDSQLATLEPPSEDEDAIRVSITKPVGEIVREAITAIGARTLPPN